MANMEVMEVCKECLKSVTCKESEFKCNICGDVFHGVCSISRIRSHDATPECIRERENIQLLNKKTNDTRQGENDEFSEPLISSNLKSKENVMHVQEGIHRHNSINHNNNSTNQPTLT